MHTLSLQQEGGGGGEDEQEAGRKGGEAGEGDHHRYGS